MKIGFIGLGVMGRPMAKNLLKAGHEVHVYDVVAKSVEDLVAAGATAEAGNAEVARATDVVITMLPNSPHVKTVVLGAGGVLEGVHPGLKIIDMSSIAPLATREVGKACAEAGVPMLEAPVSGGEQGAINGTLSLMVGGDKALFEELKPVLEAMATNISLCGDLGAGNTTKLINQHILAVEIAGIAEAFAMGKKAGVDPKVVYEAIRAGAAGSKIMDLKMPTVLERNFKPGFRLDLHIKDLNNSLETGHALGSPMPIASVVMDMMKYMSANGHGAEDHSTFDFTSESGYTLGFRRKIAHKGTHGETRGVSDGGGITTLDTYCTFTNIPGPGVRTAYFAALGSWPRGAPEGRRKPAEQRCAYARRCSESPRPRWAA